MHGRLISIEADITVPGDEHRVSVQLCPCGKRTLYRNTGRPIRTLCDCRWWVTTEWRDTGVVATGVEAEPLDVFPYLVRRALAVLFSFARGSRCRRCRLPWYLVTDHVTTCEHSPCNVHLTPLCERCWQELGITSARLPYYRAAWVEAMARSGRAGFVDNMPSWYDVRNTVFAEDPTLPFTRGV